MNIKKLFFLCLTSFSISYTAMDIYYIYFENKSIKEEITIMQYLTDEDFDIDDDEENEWIEI